MSVPYRILSAGTALGIFSMCLAQGMRTFNFVDTTYLLECINRISSGEVPYRDFFLVLPPLHYGWNWLAFECFGENALSIILTGALVNAATFLVAQSILQHLGVPAFRAWLFAVCAAMTGALAVAVSNYDADATFLCVASLACWLKSRASGSRIFLLSAGILAAMAVLTKINIGVPYLLGVTLAMSLQQLQTRRWSDLGFFLSGALLALAITAAMLYALDALGAALYQTFQFPAQRRLNFFHRLLSSFPILRPSLIKSWSYSSWYFVLVILWALGFHAASMLARGSRNIGYLLMIPLMGILLGAMQSQEWASLYGQGGVAALGLGLASKMGDDLQKPVWVKASIITALLFIAGQGFSAWRFERLGFLGEMMSSSQSFRMKKFAGFRGYGPAVSSLELAVEWSKTLPGKDSVFVWPGMAPFYLASGCKCPLPNFQVLADTGLDCGSALDSILAKEVDWVLIDFSSVVVMKLGRFKEVERKFLDHYEFAARLDRWSLFRRKTRRPASQPAVTYLVTSAPIDSSQP